ncbi:TlpA disulfide reductase family protein [Stenotrophomonas sp. HITSZ_GD]|uniref:TlpA family protein disulfide reductase n=1 Tax=Stenotrophomonas sp. HITSZ_GD TaxID=3037248 RepID=UPI00240D2DE7|nr:TlpA disulfide reductase family protein [Stenotrophomonas sp. HITSZ_GD]MDG2526379.1 TlpA disulfide reductase family protein [Stenotrophomonas sp. HITSZ_GD]
MPMTSVRAVALATCLLALAACQRQPEPAAAPAAPQPAAAPAQPAAPAEPAAPAREVTAEQPALKLPTVDGKTYDLAEHRGKWVVINFWATWCGPCLKEMPELSALHAMRNNVEVVGLAYEDIEPAEMQEFLKAHPVAYPIAIVDTYQPPADFAVPRGLPMSYLIGPDGKVAKQFLGPVEARDIEAAITAAGGKVG